MRHVCAAVCSLGLLLPVFAATADEADDLVKALQAEAGDSAGLAAKILATARTLDKNLKLQAALYEKAYELGLKQPKGYPTAIQAAQALLRADPKGSSAWREKLTRAHELALRAAPRAKKKEVGGELVAHLIRCADDLAEAGDVSEAMRHYTRAGQLGRAYAPGRAAEIAQKLKDLRARQKVIRELEQAQRLLATNAANSRARLVLIRLYVAEFDDPAKAKELLTADVGESWRTYVPLAAKEVTETAEAPCLELADWYRSLGKEATPFGREKAYRRAKAYYERFLELHAKQDAKFVLAKANLLQVEKELETLGNRPVNPDDWQVMCWHPTWRVHPLTKMTCRTAKGIFHVKNTSGVHGGARIICPKAALEGDFEIVAKAAKGTGKGFGFGLVATDGSDRFLTGGARDDKPTWHTIRVVRAQNKVTMELDGKRIGPRRFRGFHDDMKCYFSFSMESDQEIRIRSFRLRYR